MPGTRFTVVRHPSSRRHTFVSACDRVRVRPAAPREQESALVEPVTAPVPGR